MQHAPLDVAIADSGIVTEVGAEVFPGLFVVRPPAPRPRVVIVLERDEVISLGSRRLAESILNLGRILGARPQQEQLDLIRGREAKVEVGTEHSVMVPWALAQRSQETGRVATAKISFVAKHR